MYRRLRNPKEFLVSVDCPHKNHFQNSQRVDNYMETSCFIGAKCHNSCHT